MMIFKIPNHSSYFCSFEFCLFCFHPKNLVEKYETESRLRKQVEKRLEDELTVSIFENWSI